MMVSCMFSACFFYMHCPVNTSSNRGYSKKRLQSLILLPFCKATIKLVNAINVSVINIASFFTSAYFGQGIL